MGHSAASALDADGFSFLFAQGGEARCLEVAAIENVEGVEGDEALAVWMRDVDAGLLDTADIEGFGVDELHDEDAEEILVAEVFGDEDFGQAAE